MTERISRKIASRRKQGLRGDLGSNGDYGPIGPQGTNYQGYPGLTGPYGPITHGYLAYDFEDVSATGASQDDYLNYQQTSQQFIPVHQQANTLQLEQIDFSNIPNYESQTQARSAIGIGKLFTIDKMAVRLTSYNAITMKTTWQQTPSNNVLTLPIAGSYSVMVDWDDGAGFQGPTSSPPTNTYATPETVERNVKMVILGGSPTYSMQNNPSPTRTMTLLSVDRWGGISLSGNGQWFAGQTSLTAINAIDAPRLTGATNFFAAFSFCPLITFNGLDEWQIPSGLSMQATFLMTRLGSVAPIQITANWFNNPSTCHSMFGSQNEDINLYFNASFAPDCVIPATAPITALFGDCRAFNQVPPELEATSGRTDMSRVFMFCFAFAQQLPASWLSYNSSVTSYFFMFRGCSLFNQDLGSTFVTSSATTIGGLLSGCSSFNNGGSNSIESWNTTNVTDFNGCLSTCPQNYNILGTGKWNLKKGTNFSGMFFMSHIYNNGGVDIDLDVDSSYDRALEFGGMFYGCRALTVNVVDSFPSGVGTTINMQNMFNDCRLFTGSSLSSTFVNQRVTNMTAMFCGALVFVGSSNVDSWDVSGCTQFGAGPENSGCFGQTSFNRPILAASSTVWLNAVNAATTTDSMFALTPSFTNGGQQVIYKPLSVTPFCKIMFRSTNVTNYDLDFGTGTANTIDLSIFFGAPVWDSDLSNCKIDRVQNGTLFIINNAWSLSNFEATIIAWGDTRLAFAPTNCSITTDLLESSLSPTAANAVNALRTTKSWTITLL